MSGKKRRKSVITDSDSENEQDSVEENQRRLTPGIRSSERLNKKYSRTFQMPSREKVWNDIPSTKSSSDSKTQDYTGRRRRLANDFSRVTHRYNQDELYPCLTDSDESLEDFIDDSLEELSDASIESESDKVPKGHTCSKGTHDVGRGSSSSDDDQIRAKGSTRKQIIASDSGSDTEPYNTSSNKCVAMRISSDEEENSQNVVKKTKRTPKKNVLQSDSSEPETSESIVYNSSLLTHPVSKKGDSDEPETSENIVHNSSVHTDPVSRHSDSNEPETSDKVENDYNGSSDSDDPATSARKRKISKTGKSRLLESDDSDNSLVNGTMKDAEKYESLQTVEKEDSKEYSVDDLQKIDVNIVNAQSDIQENSCSSRRHIDKENTDAAGDLTIKSKIALYDAETPVCPCDSAASNFEKDLEESGYGNSPRSSSSSESSDEDSDTSSSEELERHAKHVKRQTIQQNAKKQNFQAFLEARKRFAATKK